MLPPRCSQPPCMNMAVKTVAMLAPGLSEKRPGTNAHSWMNPSPFCSYRRKTSTLMAMRTNVTYGVVRRMELSSPSGNIRLSSTCPADSSAIAIPMSTRGAFLRPMHHLAACPSAKAPLPLSAHEAFPLLCDRRRPHLAEPRVRLSARYPHCCHLGQRRRGRRVLRRLPLPQSVPPAVR